MDYFRVPLKTVLFREGGVSRVLKSSCIRPYTPVFRARLSCLTKNAWFLEVPFSLKGRFDLKAVECWEGIQERT